MDPARSAAIRRALFIELSTRKVEIAGIRTNANGLWMSQIGRNLTDAVDGLLTGKRYLIHDRDPLFTREFLGMLADAGVEVGKTTTAEPQSEYLRGEFVRSVKEACLDRMIRFGEGSCARGLPNSSRIIMANENHQGLDNRLILPYDSHAANRGRLRCRERLGGMLNYYYRQTA